MPTSVDKKYIASILFLTLVLSCNQPEKRESVKEFFIISFWGGGHYIKDKPPRLNVLNYFEYDSSGTIKIARDNRTFDIISNYNQITTKYKVMKSDKGFSELLDSVLIDKKYDTIEVYDPKSRFRPVIIYYRTDHNSKLIPISNGFLRQEKGRLTKSPFYGLWLLNKTIENIINKNEFTSLGLFKYHKKVDAIEDSIMHIFPVPPPPAPPVD